MHLRVVDGCPINPHHQCNLISYVVNDHLAFDAGALGLMPLAEQKKITSIFLSHVHADHIATLPLLVDNVYRPGPDCVKLYAKQATIDDLRQHVFNGRIWPDVLQLASPDSPFIEFRAIAHGQSIVENGVRVTAYDVNHTIPTLGFVVEDAQAAVAVVADTAPCDAIWEFLAGFDKLQAVFLEISFPNALQWLAEVAKHLTPQTFLEETRKLNRRVAWYVTHTKLEHAERIAQEVAELQIEHCQFAMGGECYRF